MNGNRLFGKFIFIMPRQKQKINIYGVSLNKTNVADLEEVIETLNQQICDLCKEQEYERASQLREKRIKLEKVLEAKSGE